MGWIWSGGMPSLRRSAMNAGQHFSGAPAHTLTNRLDLSVARAVAEQHQPGVLVLADVVEPALQDRPCERLGLEHLVHAFEEGRQVGLVLFEQRQVEGLLGGEVAVDDGLGHVCRGRHVVQARARVSASGEKLPGRPRDQLTPLICG